MTSLLPGNVELHFPVVRTRPPSGYCCELFSVVGQVMQGISAVSLAVVRPMVPSSFERFLPLHIALVRLSSESASDRTASIRIGPADCHSPGFRSHSRCRRRLRPSVACTSRSEDGSGVISLCAQRRNELCVGSLQVVRDLLRRRNPRVVLHVSRAAGRDQRLTPSGGFIDDCIAD